MADILSRLRDETTETQVLSADEVSERYMSDFSGMKAEAMVGLVLPRSTEDVSRILKLCDSAGQVITVQGGMTGIVGGALPTAGSLLLSLEKMSGIEEIDTQSGTRLFLPVRRLRLSSRQRRRQVLCFPLISVHGTLV